MKTPVTFLALLTLVAGTASAGIRVGPSGDAAIDFQTTMDLPLMAVGNHGAVGYAYRIGKFEVTTGQYTEFLNAVAATDTYELYHASMSYGYLGHGCRIQRTDVDSNGLWEYAVAAEWADRPVNLVNWADAARFANWLTNGMPTGAQDLSTTEDGSYFLNGATSIAELAAVTRKSPEAGGRYYIPTEDEWYKAAYHANDGVTGNYFDYPTGTDAVPSNDLIDPDPGNNANFNDSGYTIGYPYLRTEVGEFELSEGPYDTFDMGGNVWEWNEAIIDGLNRGYRGASWFGTITDASDRRDASPVHHDYDYGFRIAEVPEPATLGLLALGGMALLKRKK
ncbi:MAG: formylglycine-generating enzyme family protein [Planctomycetota bacterium]|jgi:formylglycine-generating enzyme required for sulfatase activity